MEKELIVKLYEQSNRRDLAALRQLFAPDFKEWSPKGDDLEAYIRQRADILENQNTHYAVEVLFQDEKGLVTAYVKVKDAERTVSRIVDIFRVADGTIAEHWSICQKA